MVEMDFVWNKYPGLWNQFWINQTRTKTILVRTDNFSLGFCRLESQQCWFKFNSLSCSFIKKLYHDVLGLSMIFFTLINASANKCIENIDRLIGLADNKWIGWITTHMDFKVNITHFTCVLTPNASLYIKSFTYNILDWYLYEAKTK